MKCTAFSPRGVALAVGLALASSVAIAQQLSEVIVEAPRVQRGVDKGPTGSIDLIAVTHHVSYADIDIGTASGARVLEQRVKDAAKAACAEITKLYPLATEAASSPPCEKTAVDKAMLQVRAAVEAAEKAKRK